MLFLLIPPRKGCSKEFLDYLIQAKPSKIIYISCDVATQARDIKYLQEFNYQVDMCQPVDMFPLLLILKISLD